MRENNYIRKFNNKLHFYTLLFTVSSVIIAVSVIFTLFPVSRYCLLACIELFDIQTVYLIILESLYFVYISYDYMDEPKQSGFHNLEYITASIISYIYPMLFGLSVAKFVLYVFSFSSLDSPF